MSNNHDVLEGSPSQACCSTVEVRLLSFWEARNMKRGGELIGLDTLLLEAKVVLFSKLIIIVTTLNVHRLTTYRNMYSLGGFDVPRCNQNYRLYDSPFLIQFSDSPTELVLPILQDKQLTHVLQPSVFLFFNCNQRATKAMDICKTAKTRNICRLPIAQSVNLYIVNVSPLGSEQFEFQVENIKFLEFKPSVKFRGCISLCNLIIAPSTSLKSECAKVLKTRSKNFYMFTSIGSGC
ncbi:hypothetical protein IGI04_036001 [Brassica rapa subsp. trilocularis]|uniref:Uncharacterized protein n=1 Tax=Brassica rapa subsp. trilocularis TaxID=1813537 RepID=A0ABQ7LH13_BRACM|nr:hypothetical protein IGI04_036001 [Brassica rapa subsp. trilocularis]